MGSKISSESRACKRPVFSATNSITRRANCHYNIQTPETSFAANMCRLLPRTFRAAISKAWSLSPKFIKTPGGLAYGFWAVWHCCTDHTIPQEVMLTWSHMYQHPSWKHALTTHRPCRQRYGIWVLSRPASPFTVSDGWGMLGHWGSAETLHKQIKNHTLSISADPSLRGSALRRGLFLKPAGASLFRMRSPSSFLSFLGTILLSF